MHRLRRTWNAVDDGQDAEQTSAVAAVPDLPPTKPQDSLRAGRESALLSIPVSRELASRAIGRIVPQPGALIGHRARYPE